MVHLLCHHVVLFWSYRPGGTKKWQIKRLYILGTFQREIMKSFLFNLNSVWRKELPWFVNASFETLICSKVKIRKKK